MQLSTVDLWEGHCLHFKPAAATNTRVLSMQIAGSGANRGKVGAAISEMAFMMTGDGSSLISLQDLSMRASKSKRLHQTVKAGLAGPSGGSQHDFVSDCALPEAFTARTGASAGIKRRPRAQKGGFSTQRVALLKTPDPPSSLMNEVGAGSSAPAMGRSAKLRV